MNTMTISLNSARFGYWLTCDECGSSLGSGDVLEHPRFEKTLWRNEDKIHKPIKCPHVGKKVQNPFRRMVTNPPV